MNCDAEFQILTQIKQAIVSEKIQDIILFGSRAKGTARSGSDIDIAIVSDRMAFKDICALSLKIDELNLPYKVDLVDYNNITNQELKDHIDRVGVHLL